MARVRDTVLYKSISPFVKSITKKQLQAELSKVRKIGDGGIYPVTLEEDGLLAAFVWFRTPQGNEFWSNLFTEISNNMEASDEPNH